MASWNWYRYFHRHRDQWNLYERCVRGSRRSPARSRVNAIEMGLIQDAVGEKRDLRDLRARCHRENARCEALREAFTFVDESRGKPRFGYQQPRHPLSRLDLSAAGVSAVTPGHQSIFTTACSVLQAPAPAAATPGSVCLAGSSSVPIFSGPRFVVSRATSRTVLPVWNASLAMAAAAS